MVRTVVRVLIVIFGGMIASRLVEMYLTSERGRRSVVSRGMADLTTHEGVELSQRYARAVASTLGTALVAVEASVTSGYFNPRRAGWPERIMTGAELLLAIGRLAQIASDFIEERRQLIEDGRMS